jgi:hypothetical protein
MHCKRYIAVIGTAIATITLLASPVQAATQRPADAARTARTAVVLTSEVEASTSVCEAIEETIVEYEILAIDYPAYFADVYYWMGVYLKYGC